jgi:hypothetical protein
MKQYLASVFFWLAAIYCFVNASYAFRCPAKYLKARWTLTRGLRPNPSSNAYAAGIMSLIGGAFFGSLGYFVLRDILSK